MDDNWHDSELMPGPLTEKEKAGIEKAVAAARTSDIALIVVGGGQRTCGENKSRSS